MTPAFNMLLCRIYRNIFKLYISLIFTVPSFFKVFGLVKGTKVGLVVDVSGLSDRPRLEGFQKDLLVSNNRADFGYCNVLIKTQS